MFDIGVNLTSLQFAKDHPDVMLRAQQAGISGMMLTGTNLYESEQAIQLASYYPNCWSTVGVHPHYARQWQASTGDVLRHWVTAPHVVAMGECGLDFNRNFSTPLEQEYAFTEQLALACELNMPVFLHCRDAYPRFFDLLDPWMDRLPGGVLHCFTGSETELQDSLSRGLYIGITGWVCDERRGLAVRKLLPCIPAQKLLLETDAPYLLPRDLELKASSRRNEPCYLPHILNKVAKWRAEDPVLLEQITDDNAHRLFRIDFKGES